MKPHAWLCRKNIIQPKHQSPNLRFSDSWFWECSVCGRNFGVSEVPGSRPSELDMIYFRIESDCDVEITKKVMES